MKVSPRAIANDTNFPLLTNGFMDLLNTVTHGSLAGELNRYAPGNCLAIDCYIFAHA